ncbi:hypothetical protein [Rhodovibrio salinarum]|uniref:Ankyrin repeat-containing protein n=1 Tax=Rhodovibrio salinarum TaxID=1087 RepID=A0A934V150_9PROT|nr:hypothetical protein [Rhodovibrio salinarum]MBK1698351.1 hypothetical protein [Rhodovibrio salinarum]
MAAESVEQLHGEMLARLEKGSGRFSNLFKNWMKFENNSERMFKARAANGGSYLLARLADYEVSRALVVLETVMEFWDRERFALYVNAEDNDGNGIWHYLADNLRLNEGRDTLKFAHILIKLDVDFARRNKYGISPLGKMLVPEPKWQSINALIQTKHLQIVNVENAVAEQAKGDQGKLANMMCGIFAADLSDNRALLSQHCLKQAVQSNTDKEQRQATCRLFFDYINAEDGTTAFHKLLGHANTAMFEDLLGLLLQQTEETVVGMSPPDVATKKVYRQAVLCRRLLKRDKARRTLFVHCLLLGKTAYLRKLTGMLLNDELAIKKLVRGEPQPQPVVIDKTSPAPSNPLLSALLARDRRGDTLMHLAILQGDKGALEVALHGLASNDVHAMLTKVPDASGASPVEMVDLEKAKARLGRAVKSGRLPMEVANARMKRLAKLDKGLRSYINDKIAEIEALASDTKGGAPVAPNFDVRKMAGAA